MSRRTERVGNLLRSVISEIILHRLADPRIDPVKVSVTRVEVPTDLMTAKVYISVMGGEAAERLTLQALKTASGHIQELVGREVELRHTPILSFLIDVQFRKTIEILAIIQETSEEIRIKDAERAEQEALNPEPQDDEL